MSSIPLTTITTSEFFSAVAWSLYNTDFGYE